MNTERSRRFAKISRRFAEANKDLLEEVKKSPSVQCLEDVVQARISEFFNWLDDTANDKPFSIDCSVIDDVFPLLDQKTKNVL